ncbi:MAG: DUF5777 family beta-barrel protein [Bacteroidota bacterium]
MKNIVTIRRFLALTFALGLAWASCAQEFAHQTFKDTRVINTPSVETLQKRKLDFRISHRFGDLAGASGGWPTFYGLENAADILFGFEYGVTDQLTLGFSRTKGAGPLRQLLNGSIKYRLLRQRRAGGNPISITIYALSSFSTSPRVDDPEVLTSFPKTLHRMANHISVLIGRKFSDRFSLQVIPGYTHRNLVPTQDENGLFSMSFATRIQLSKVFGFIFDGTFTFSDLRNSENGYYPALGVGIEIETGGHVFQINLTNATGIMETDYIPNTRSNWGDGQFRLGFTISRLFNL